MKFTEKRIVGVGDDHMIIETVDEEYVLVSCRWKDGWAKISNYILSFTKWDDYDRPFSEVSEEEYEIARYNLAHISDLSDVRHFRHGDQSRRNNCE